MIAGTWSAVPRPSIVTVKTGDNIVSESCLLQPQKPTVLRKVCVFPLLILPSTTLLHVFTCCPTYACVPITLLYGHCQYDKPPNGTSRPAKACFCFTIPHKYPMAVKLIHQPG
ncbi:unnamed protein product [Clavelina lepadiformis]|uniref:Uncharacterized protein n=1 Tax=Clavelina lepadiformis TaxID=159417 RepID=A0ABP0FXN9_CLALP